MADPADKTGEQLTLEIAEKTRSRIIASSSLNFQIELMEHVGEEDTPQLILISEHLVEEFTEDVRLTKTSIRKYFNYPHTLPFVARQSGEIIGYIIGVPLEYFSNDPSFQCDRNLGEKNTLYTYAFVVFQKYKGSGFAKTLKRVYLSWAKKKGFKYVSGHVREGVSQRFTGSVQILQRFDNWHGTNKRFEYYRRLLVPQNQPETPEQNPPLVAKI
ncbi:MAG: GNAT family N-acetyltransferase [Candidatus Marinimicrobia bacterium]|jgi:predicted GNAT superfamily acetyltransferase|nr:GNAT family N-acetyltransferase [Candidatus Neomarinimicrobiota bacterium]MDP7060193.1 GNAT family N-acetyltransferase [Candidatus Neomarinimicrobiota bacterium]|tara:strand:- start:407 stop:1051 length:645 start_codon:yes stop_codon:yes gene_type:complete